MAQTVFDERDLAEISSPEFPDERLIVCRNPILADQRQRSRKELLAATKKDLMAIVKSHPTRQEAAAGRRRDRRTCGQGDQRNKVGKHFITTITDNAYRDLAKVERAFHSFEIDSGSEGEADLSP